MLHEKFPQIEAILNYAEETFLFVKQKKHNNNFKKKLKLTRRISHHSNVLHYLLQLHNFRKCNLFYKLSNKSPIFFISLKLLTKNNAPFRKTFIQVFDKL